MRKSLFVFAACAMSSAAAFAADPVVSYVTLSQDPVNSNVIIEYSLTGADAVITVDILTNDTSIGEQNFTHIVGDVNRLVAPDAENRKRIVWTCVRDIPNVKIDSGVTVHVNAWAADNPPNYFVMDLISGARNYYVSTNALPDGGLANDAYKTTKLVMRRIPADGESFTMGSPEGEWGRATSDMVQHQVSFTNDFYMGIYELTYKQYDCAFHGNQGTITPANAKLPVKGMNYETVRGTTYNWPADGHSVRTTGRVIGLLRSLTGYLVEIDLPTEAQWEYACRAGSTTAWNNDVYRGMPNEYNREKELMWSSDFADGTTHEVGLLVPNAWGLYDMHGNVCELCLDRWANGSEASDGSAVVDPPGPDSTQTYRVARGGSYDKSKSACRSASRDAVQGSTANATEGFRVVCPAVAK